MLDTRLVTPLPRGVTLNDPLLLASGCCGYGEEYADIIDPCTIGGGITKAVSLEPRAGNVPPRLRETPAGLLNCIGLQNPGVERFVGETLQRLVWGGFRFIINVVGHSPLEFAAVISAIEAALSDIAVNRHIAAGGVGETGGFAGYELDLSCPNVDSGTQFATDELLLRDTVARARAVTEALLIAKLSPNVTDIVPYARLAQESGADAVTIANTWNGVSIDIATRRSHLARPSAGLSGPAIRPATLYHVWRCHRALPKLPILGCGGITDADSAIQYLLAGATALQIGTGLFLNPACVKEIQHGLATYLDQQGEPSLAAITGAYRDE
jgi:dihydroorotate dehydrogenase (NAD+) catalytic subunit